MKRFIQSTLMLLLFITSSIQVVTAQKKFAGNGEKQKSTNVLLKKCVTQDLIDQKYQNDPAFKAMMDQREADYQTWKANHSDELNTIAAKATTLTGPVTIPVVMHIVLPNPYSVTDANCQYVIDRLNSDFSGFNPDSTNAVAFYPIRGHSLIRFCLAKRDPAGNATNGVERRISATASNTSTTNDPIKNSTLGGLDSWNNLLYYNIWVGNFTTNGLLGYSNSIGPGPTSQDGYVSNYTTFSDNSCYPGFGGVFLLGRTAVHEIGHNFGLYHIWGDGTTCVSGQDFRQLPGSCTLPNTLLGGIDDTPNQSASTSGCPTGTQPTNCAVGPNPPGKNYQNYMDYTDDACYSMFTKGQVERMHWVLENCRPGYLTSLGCVPPASASSLDAAAVDVVSPGGVEWIQATCSSVSYPLAGGCTGTFTPRVRIKNNGTTTLTSVTIVVTINAVTLSTTVVPVNLVAGASTVVVLPVATLVNGANNISYTVSAPNGGIDGVAGNNTVSTTANFVAAGSVNAPIANDFVSATFPGANWAIVNPNAGSTTFVRNNNGNTNAGSAFMDCFNYASTGHTDEIRSVVLNTGVTDSIIIEFDYAHRNYSATFSERMQVLTSADCGATFTATSFDRSGAALATTTPASGTAGYLTPLASDWRRIRVAVGKANAFPANQIMVAIRVTNGYGNNIFIDNININPKFPVDLSASAILVPTAGSQCGVTFSPVVTVKNVGADPIASFKVGYVLDNGTPVVSNTFNVPLVSGATYTATLPSVTTTAGLHTLKGFCATALGGASGLVADIIFGNDTLTRAFTVKPLLASPINENFVGATFPPADWGINNPNANVTWVRSVNGNVNAGSAFFSNWPSNVPGQIDDLLSPAINTDSTDDVQVTFDAAHKVYTGYDDSLHIVYSTTCANSFINSSLLMGGVDYGSGNSTANYLTPIASDWRNKTVSIPVTAADGTNSSMIVGFRNKNAFGNNTFLDNINIRSQYKNDIAPIELVNPLMACGLTITPRIRVRNNGSYITQSFRANYTIDGGAVQSTNVTGLTLPRFGTTLVNLPTQTVSAGPHRLVIYTSNLISSGSSFGDKDLLNDTIVITFNATAIQTGSVTENFEGNSFLPSPNWTIVNEDENATTPSLSGRTWVKSNVGNSGSSTVMQNFNYKPSTNKSDFLVTPLLTYTNVDSVFVSFDVAAKTRLYPGSTQFALDTLEVLVLKDCGNTYTSVWKKWGEDLQTIADPNYSNIDSFIPQANSWKNVKVNITQAAGTSAASAGVVFKSTSNGDNNIYLDNINVRPLTFPAKLKQQGYLLYPSPFSGSFNIQHFLAPTDLRSIGVYDSRGTLVFGKQFGANGANSTEKVDISREAAGVYTVKLSYTNKQIVERIIKVNN
jgi:Pregnancy-associated plasma protein-A/Secretion system C-terminal sorting domain